MTAHDERQRIGRLTHQLDLVAQRVGLTSDERRTRSDVLRKERTQLIERWWRVRRACDRHRRRSTSA